VKLIFSGNAWEDYLYRQKTDKNMLKRINRLIHEHRIVYRPAEDAIFIAQLRYHY